jgi:CheY-specific phosphatase CheX
MSLLKVDDVLLEGVVRGTLRGLEMASVTPAPVGASRFFMASRPVSVLVGLTGQCNGQVALNLSERGLLHLAGRMLMEDSIELGEAAFDSIMEVGNLVAGSIKEELRGTAFEADQLTVPSLVLGASYSIFYARGMSSVAVEFEIEELPVTFDRDRFFTTSVSVIRRAA